MSDFPRPHAPQVDGTLGLEPKPADAQSACCCPAQTSARPSCRIAPPPSVSDRDFIPRLRIHALPTTTAPGSEGGGPRRSRKRRKGLPSPTAHSAKHGAVAVAEAEAVEGPLPADHYGQGPGRSPGGALLASCPLTSPSSAAWLGQWETDTLASRQMGFALQSLMRLPN